MKKRFVQNDNNNCICYYRYSSHAQNESSIETQQKIAHKYAEEHGLNIVKEYPEPARSGLDTDRPMYRLMLHEISKIKPAYLILWKTDRLGRDTYELVVAKKAIADAGCKIVYTGDTNLNSDEPTSVFFEGIMNAQAEYYSLNLRQNVIEGLRNNAENGLYNGRKLLGYTVDDTKHYIIDDNTAPIVIRIFNHYADGKGIKEIADDLNSQGLHTTTGGKFNINGLRHILKNRAYIGEYAYADIVIPNGMPAIISEELFERVQKRFELNRHKPKPVAAIKDATTEELAPRFWLTGKLFCGHCKESMHGISGTSKSGKIHYYYACLNHRKHKCKLKNISKDFIEYAVTDILRDFLSDSENLASLAVDVSNYAKKMYSNDSYLKSLQKEFASVEKKINNLVDAIANGCYNDSVQQKLSELEIQKEALKDAIESEQIKLSLANNDNSIQHYFEMYAHADFEDEDTRDMIFDYFIDKIYVYDDKLLIDLYYSDDRREISLDAFWAAYEYAKDCIDCIDEFSDSDGVRHEHGQVHLATSCRTLNIAVYQTRLLIIHELERR